MRRHDGHELPGTPEDQTQLNRRDLVLKALALGGGVAAAAALAPAEALAADGDVVHVGQLATTGSANPVFSGQNTGSGPGIAVDAAQHDGIRAFAHGAAKSGLYAVHDGDGYGVFAVGRRAGVHGETSAGGRGVDGFSSANDGVMGVSTAATKSGVYAYNDNTAGYGVWARGGSVGVVGLASSAAATGVRAENGAGGVGLRVVGKTAMQRSGLATTVAGNKSVTVTVPGGLTAASKYLVTVQGNPGTGVFVAYAKYLNATQFRVYFNKACTKAAKLAWMVLD
jgi:hypothetical protein